MLSIGQSFVWHSIGFDSWVGVLGKVVYEIRQEEDGTYYRSIYGECDYESLRRYFDLDHEYNIDYEKVPKEIKSIFRNRLGIRILQQDAFECLISFICSANNNVPRITHMVNNLKKSFGTFLTEASFNNETMTFYTFPTLEQLSTVNTDTLLKLGFGYRANYIVKTVHTLQAHGLEWLYNLRHCNTHDAKQLLTKLPHLYLMYSHFPLTFLTPPSRRLSTIELDTPIIPLLSNLREMQWSGVGRKVADCVLLFGLGKREVVPVDVHVRKISESLFGLKLSKSLSDDDYNKIQTTFQNFAGDNAGWAQAVLFINSLVNNKKA